MPRRLVVAAVAVLGARGRGTAVGGGNAAGITTTASQAYPTGQAEITAATAGVRVAAVLSRDGARQGWWGGCRRWWRWGGVGLLAAAVTELQGGKRVNT